MKNILIPSGENTPEISENAQSASFIVSGASAPDNPVAFFSQVNEKMEAFVARTTGPKIIRFDLVYFNSSSAKFIYLMLKKLISVDSVKVEWVYEEGDTDILESGQDYQKLSGLDFDFVVKPAQ